MSGIKHHEDEDEDEDEWRHECIRTELRGGGDTCM
jgi:hypothetical protein